MSNPLAVSDRWPVDLSDLHGEARRAFHGDAYTAAVLVCQKLVMVCARREGADEGLSFSTYANHLAVLLGFHRAATLIDRMRLIGEDASHPFRSVNRQDAQRVLDIATYILNTLYSSPDPAS